MRKLAIRPVVLAAALLLTAMFLLAATEKAKPHYVGATKCKGCHKAQYESWAKTKHATAFDALSDEEKKKPECVTCHITGKLEDGTLVEGVQCEACHGPGSEFKSIKIMNKKKWAADPETHQKMAIAAGLIYPGEKDCTRCHKKEGNPNFKPFDFAKRKGQVHVMKAAEAGEKKVEKAKEAGETEAKKAEDTTGKK